MFLSLVIQNLCNVIQKSRKVNSFNDYRNMEKKDFENEALQAQQEGASLQKKEEQTDEYQVSKMLEWLMPWVEKTDGAQTVGYWQDRLPTTMMLKLLELWLTEENRERLRNILQYYHPLDRAAMAYALVLYVLTGHKMTFKTAVAKQHFKVMQKAIKQDMPELSFSGHMKYMIRRYGTKK